MILELWRRRDSLSVEESPRAYFFRATRNRAINHLRHGRPPDRCREVYELSRAHGLRYAEIAAALGISVKTAEAQMGKALRILRERLAPWLLPGDAGGGASGS